MGPYGAPSDIVSSVQDLQSGFRISDLAPPPFSNLWWKQDRGKMILHHIENIERELIQLVQVP